MRITSSKRLAPEPGTPYLHEEQRSDMLEGKKLPACL